MGILCILFASIMWALEPVFAKISYSNSDFIHTSAVRAFVISFIALFYAIATKGKLKLEAKKFSKIVYIAIVGTIFADLIYFLALTKVAVINAVIIAHMQPIFIMAFGIFLLNENLNKYDYAGITAMFLSSLFITTKSFQNFASLKFGSFGDLLVLFATIAWATTAIVARKY